jgi:hypothetical protein
MKNHVPQCIECRLQKIMFRGVTYSYGESFSIECRLQKIMFRGVTYSYGESCSPECRLREIMFRGVTYFYRESFSTECRLREIMFHVVMYSAWGIMFHRVSPAGRVLYSYVESCSIFFASGKSCGGTYSYRESFSIECCLREILFRGVTYSYRESFSIECRLREIMFREVESFFVFRLSRSWRSDFLLFLISAAVAVSRLTCHRSADKLFTPISRIFANRNSEMF